MFTRIEERQRERAYAILALPGLCKEREDTERKLGQLGSAVVLDGRIPSVALEVRRAYESYYALCNRVAECLESILWSPEHSPKNVPMRDVYWQYLGSLLGATPTEDDVRRHMAPLTAGQLPHYESLAESASRRLADLHAAFDEWPTTSTPPDWRWRQDQVAARAGHKCEQCRKRHITTGVQFHVHHVKARSEGGTHELRNLRWLCEICHGKQPGRGPSKSRVRRRSTRGSS